MEDKYTNEELRYFEEITDGLIIWLFSSNDKRHAIIKTIKQAYDKGKLQNLTEIHKGEENGS